MVIVSELCSRSVLCAGCKPVWRTYVHFRNCDMQPHAYVFIIAALFSIRTLFLRVWELWSLEYAFQYVLLRRAFATA